MKLLFLFVSTVISSGIDTKASPLKRNVPSVSITVSILQLTNYVSLLLFSVYATDLNEYLDEKLRQSKIEFIKLHIQETSPSKSV